MSEWSAKVPTKPGRYLVRREETEDEWALGADGMFRQNKPLEKPILGRTHRTLWPNAWNEGVMFKEAT